jgi:hypothetical protein
MKLDKMTNYRKHLTGNEVEKLLAATMGCLHQWFPHEPQYLKIKLTCH